jgi:exosortase/archaeosortase family protein
LLLVGALRSGAAERYLLAPVTRLQESIALWYFGGERLPITVATNCSGLDVVALCFAFTLAYPAAWRARLRGALLGALLILTLNTLRIVTLAQLSSSPLFLPAHLYVWPALLVLATAVYVASWMWIESEGWCALQLEQRRTIRFATLAAALLLLYLLIAPWYLRSEAVGSLAALTAAAAAGLLGALGIDAQLAGRVLITPGGAWSVTNECVMTPLMPLYLAAGAAVTRTGWQRLAWVAAFAPLFFTLAILRLLTVALPPQLFGAPGVITHAFYQLLVAAALVAAAAWYGVPVEHPRERIRRSARVAIRAGAVGLAVAWLAGELGSAAATAAPAVVPHLPWLAVAGAPADGAQGALALLPAFQLGLFAALATAWWGRAPALRWLGGLGLLLATQAVLLAATGPALPGASALLIVLLRAWALSIPALLAAAVTAPAFGAMLRDASRSNRPAVDARAVASGD